MFEPSPVCFPDLSLVLRNVGMIVHQMLYKLVLSDPHLPKLMDQALIILKQRNELWSCLQLHRSVKSLLDKYKMDY